MARGDEPREERKIMDALKFRTIREGLGLTRYDLIRAFDVREKTIREWERGTMAVPEPVAEWLSERFGKFMADLDDVEESVTLDGSTAEGRALAFAAMVLCSEVTIEGKTAA